MSKLKAAFTCYTEQDLGQQINFLKANMIEEKPTVRSVQLVGNFSLEAQAFLEKGGLGGNAIVDLQQKISLLDNARCFLEIRQRKAASVYLNYCYIFIPRRELR